jgi:LysM repeat protein
MKTVIVRNNQSLWDIAIQEYGTVEAVFDLAMANGLGITDILTAGQVLNVPESEYVNAEVVAYYRKNDLHPATGETNITETAIPHPPETESCEWIILS